MTKASTTKDKDKAKVDTTTIHLGLSARAASLVRVAVQIETEGPRADDHTEEELEMGKKIIEEIDSQTKGAKK